VRRIQRIATFIAAADLAAIFFDDVRALLTERYQSGGIQLRIG
jgi:hypothetical protein